MSDVANSAKLTTLDYILSVMDTAQSPLDFAIIFHFNHKLDLEALRRGAYSALTPNLGSIGTVMSCSE